MSSCNVSVLIFTLDEEENLPYCLDSLYWCDDIKVIDSFSKDATLSICRARSVPVYQHAFEGFGTQRNWALDNVPLKHDWVLILDADEKVPEALARELIRVASDPPAIIGAYRLRRRLHLWGRWLRHSSLYPTWVVRFAHRRRIRYVNRGHAETQEVDGGIGELEGHLIDENHTGLDAWFERQNRYTTQEAQFELGVEASGSPDARSISGGPQVRRAILKKIAAQIPCRGLVYFVYCYFFRLGFLDGLDGLMFCRMKAMYQEMIAIKKFDARKREPRVLRDAQRHRQS